MVESQPLNEAAYSMETVRLKRALGREEEEENQETHKGEEWGQGVISKYKHQGAVMSTRFHYLSFHHLLVAYML